MMVDSHSKANNKAQAGSDSGANIIRSPPLSTSSPLEDFLNHTKAKSSPNASISVANRSYISSAQKSSVTGVTSACSGLSYNSKNFCKRDDDSINAIQSGPPPIPLSQDELLDLAQRARHSVAEKFKDSPNHAVAAAHLRKLPRFDINEILLGRELGRGQFGSVSEVTSIVLRKQERSEQERERQIVQQLVLRQDGIGKGDSRYAIKLLHSKHTSNQAIFYNCFRDMTVEVHVLAGLDHRHIVKLRGVASPTSPVDQSFFLTDRLYGTLKHTLAQWRSMQRNLDRRCKTLTLIAAQLKERKRDFLELRLRCLRDVASAIVYLHQHNIIQRDLKPDNIGFDVRGEIKLFDFGLSTELPHSDPHLDPMHPLPTYNLTAKTGSIRYMAPENYKAEPYNQTIDIYALSIIAWQVISLQHLYPNFHKEMVVNLVIQRGIRPELANTRFLSSPMQFLLKNMWSTVLDERPPAKQVLAHFQNELSLVKQAKEHSPETENESRRPPTPKQATPPSQVYVALLAVARKMQQELSAQGMIKDRTWHFRTYPKTFLHSQAMEWLVQKVRLKFSAYITSYPLAFTDQQARNVAARLGNLLIKQGYLTHVCNEHNFDPSDTDTILYFKFHDCVMDDDFQKSGFATLTERETDQLEHDLWLRILMEVFAACQLSEPKSSDHHGALDQPGSGEADSESAPVVERAEQDQSLKKQDSSSRSRPTPETPKRTVSPIPQTFHERAVTPSTRSRVDPSTPSTRSRLDPSTPSRLEQSIPLSSSISISTTSSRSSSRSKRQSSSGQASSSKSVCSNRSSRSNCSSLTKRSRAKSAGSRSSRASRNTTMHTSNTRPEADIVALLSVARDLQASLDSLNRIKDRLWYFKKYKKCFLHNEAMEWLIQYVKKESPRTFMFNDDDIDDIAATLGNQLIEFGYVSHVCNDHHFYAGDMETLLFFKFNEDRLQRDFQRVSLASRTPAQKREFQIANLMNITKETCQQPAEQALEAMVAQPQEMDSMEGLTTPTRASTLDQSRSVKSFRCNSQVEVAVLSLAMQLQKDFQTHKKIKDRMWMLKIYKKCFLHNEALEWLAYNVRVRYQNQYGQSRLPVSEAQALHVAARLGNLLINHGYASHVCHDHLFSTDLNVVLFFRFHDYFMEEDLNSIGVLTNEQNARKLQALFVAMTAIELFPNGEPQPTTIRQADEASQSLEAVQPDLQDEQDTLDRDDATEQVKHSSPRRASSTSLVEVKTQALGGDLVVKCVNNSNRNNVSQVSNITHNRKKTKRPKVDVALLSIAREMQHEFNSQRKIKDRRWHLKLYKKCFLHHEAMAWLVEQVKAHHHVLHMTKHTGRLTETQAREVAAQLGNGLISKGYVSHVCYEHTFHPHDQETLLFFRFHLVVMEQDCLTSSIRSLSSRETKQLQADLYACLIRDTLA